MISILNFKIEFHWSSGGGNLNLNIHEASYDVNSTLDSSWAWILLAAGSEAATRDGLVRDRIGPEQGQLLGFRVFSRTNPSSFKMFLGSRLAVILTDLHFYRGGSGETKCLKCRHEFFVTPGADGVWLIATQTSARMEYFKIKLRIRPHYMCSLCDVKWASLK